MGKRDALGGIDYTLLRQVVTQEQIGELRREDVEHGTTSVCAPPYYAKQAKDFMRDKLAICTVIGFFNGDTTTVAKVFETEDVVKNDADEIDMVINIDLVKTGYYDQVLDEIRQVKAACGGRCLKTTIETCSLTGEGRKEMCRAVTGPGADSIKTSTGFSAAGAMPEDVTLMRKYLGPGVKVKTTGGIASIEDAERFIELGADRLGADRLIPQTGNLNQAL